MDVVTAAILAALTRADCAVIIPGRTKADPFSLFFGDKPIYLPFEPDDITNAAMWLRTLELDRPVPAEARARVPLFASDDVCVPLTHYEADAVFNSMAKDPSAPTPNLSHSTVDASGLLVLFLHLGMTQRKFKLWCAGCRQRQ